MMRQMDEADAIGADSEHEQNSHIHRGSRDFQVWRPQVLTLMRCT